MKKIILSLALIIASTTVFSQVTVSPGIKAGFNLANLSNVDESTAKLGLQGGLYVNLHLARFYELQIETTYSNQGTTFEYSDFDSTYEEDLDLEYVSLNLANKFFPVPDIGLNLIIGPSLDILVNSAYYNDATPIDISFFGGIGYEFPFGLGLEVRYKQGIIDVRDDYYNDYYYDDYDDNYYDNDSALNGVIQFGVTYKFDFSKM
ncbi:porin family protein [Oceanihabitans sp. 2_MG-2023]|uniref:porin family protein n=1 Tax=Oceanihabitans sp. 2_MG-2023 TaxID=3062661 RepID=UPI0026E198B6|nr:porin family protein [Oceanihabitans sp. 2_MG-2023]MDO6596019.1 porin family protein [Oceanihabitans sp. 2_MG-2023]